MGQNNIKNLKARRVYGTPLSRYAKDPIPLDQKTLTEFGKVILKAIQIEAKRDAAMTAAMKPGEPVRMTVAHKIAESLKCRIVGERTLEFYSTHPLINQFTEGEPPFPMTWLTKQRGVGAVPMKNAAGVTVFRMAPDIGAKETNAERVARLMRNPGSKPNNTFWFHPGFRKYNFLERGARKGRAQVMEMFAERVVSNLLSSTDLLQ